MKKYLLKTNFLHNGGDESAAMVSEWFDSFDDALQTYCDGLGLRCLDDETQTVRLDIFKAVGDRFVKLLGSHDFSTILWATLPDGWKKIKGECPVDGWYWCTNGKRGEMRITGLIKDWRI